MSRLVSNIYHCIYTPLASPGLRGKRFTGRLSESDKHERKVAREIETTLRQLERPRKKKPPLSAKGRESHRKQQARWARENPECIADAQHKWREKQAPELFRQYDRDSYAASPEKKKARSRAYYDANRDAINAKRRETADRERINAARRAKAAAARAEREALRTPVKKIKAAIMPPHRV